MTSTDQVPSNTSPAGPENEVFRLHTPMHLIPAVGSVRAVSSPTPFMINGVKIWSSAPIHIYDGGGEFSVCLQPADALGADFVDGWHKLPDELKVRVLAFNLSHEMEIDYHRSLNQGYDITNFGHHLRSTPEIASFARDLYYARNTFRLRQQNYPFNARPSQANGGQYLAYPRRPLNSLVRSIILELSSIHLDLRHARRLANGDCGFENLRHIEVQIDMYLPFRWERRNPVIEDGQRNPVRFGCEGSVEFKNRFDEEDTEEEQQIRSAARERIQLMFFFGCNKNKRGVVAVGKTESE